jgi:hypothetical protein
MQRHANPKNLPAFVLAPAEVFKQWKDTIADNMSGYFTVMEYYGDSRGPTSDFPKDLTSEHAIFNGDESNRRVIVLSTLRTIDE